MGGSLRETLTAVLRLIIPPSSDGRLPGADAYDLWGYLETAAPEHRPAIAKDLEQLDLQSQSRFGKDFAALDVPLAKQLVEELRQAQPEFLGELARQTICCYYQQDRVLAAIGMEPRPPFPEGYDVPAGDLSLLDPVRRRGKLFRDD